ncbi:hypothetical protein DL98DRAFT_564041 [Cadophora sp. DSE1049]|nr:hypothetical protein DL98DRAFT_564041 [Cadophora sp. DSE1049]
MPHHPRLRRVPDAVRVRVSRACAVCRARKSRCITLHTGACQRCVEKGEECDLDASQPSLSPAISSTASINDQQMSRSPPVSFRRENGAEAPTSLETSQVRVLGCSAESNRLPTALSTTGSVFETSPTGTKLDCTVRSSEEQSPAPSEEPEGAILVVEDLGRTQYTGLRSNESFLLCVQDVLHATTRKKDLAEADRHTLKNAHIVQLPSVQSKECIEAMEAFPPREIAAFLVSTFFYYVEATFFYCDREWFHTTLNSVLAGNASWNVADDAFICFALLVFAFGSQFAHLRSRAKSQDSLPSDIDPGKRFYDCAQKLIPRVIATCTLKGIQVCLLAGLYNLPYNLPDTSYLYLGMAMRMSVASGLHRKTPAARLDPRLTEVRNRLWWSVFSIDKRTSIALGRPSSIAEDAVDAPFPKYHPSLDSLEYQSNVQHQVEYLKLTRIISQIVQNTPLESKPSCVHGLSQQLKQWRSQLFSNLHPNDLLPSERNFRTTVHLHIHYHWAWILMGRACLLQISRERIQAVSNSAYHHASTAALIILILHSILQHGDETSRIIDDGVDMLRYMARGGCRGASSDLQTIEQLRRLASDLRQKIYQDESNASTQVPMQPTSMADSYQAWVEWMSEQEASRSHLPDPDTSCSQLDSETSNGVSEMRSHERYFGFETGSNDNISDLLDYRSIDQGSLSWNFDTFNGLAVQGEVPRGFEWDDGRLDVLDMTQLLGSYNDQTTYGQG